MTFLDLPVPNEYIDIGGLIILFVVAVGLVHRAESGSFRHFFRWQPVGPAPKDPQVSSSRWVVVRSLLGVLYRDVFAARVLGTCSRAKRLSHVGLFWGFVLLALSTVLAFLTNPTNLVLPLWDPVKVTGNVGGALVLVGFAGMFYARYNERAPVWRLTRSDVFLMILMLAVLTGFVTQQAEYSEGYTSWVSPTFWIHMVFVVGLLATAPFTKFFHAVSKPIALLREAIDAESEREPLLPAPELRKGANPD